MKLDGELAPTTSRGKKKKTVIWNQKIDKLTSILDHNLAKSAPDLTNSEIYIENTVYGLTPGQRPNALLPSKSDVNVKQSLEDNKLELKKRRAT